ncbi:hypothetical protein THMIRHAM_21530 [Thiomicrorhabdus immobilis]|uniref:Uncharacterized protein n=1 Tax=Thiomicrorhabdus immobilis TaxID=2791037 RepID=A0ABN6CZI1_9GAMM|nr:hypothetical protein [Thiomicrorhabdus immobilis]BCN94368.1 hypothetical protein THMIRHAM_21530 [Thiomicrorhabdus immobilis]
MIEKEEVHETWVIAADDNTVKEQASSNSANPNVKAELQTEGKSATTTAKPPVTKTAPVKKTPARKVAAAKKAETKAETKAPAKATANRAAQTKNAPANAAKKTASASQPEASNESQHIADKINAFARRRVWPD